MKKFLAALLVLLALSLTIGSVALPAAESGVIARWVDISAKAEMPLYQALLMVGKLRALEIGLSISAAI